MRALALALVLLVGCVCPATAGAPRFVGSLSAYDVELPAETAAARVACRTPEPVYPEGAEEVINVLPPCVRLLVASRDRILGGARALARYPASLDETHARDILSARRKLTRDLLTFADAMIDRAPPREAQPRRDLAGRVVGPPTDRIEANPTAEGVAGLWLAVRADGPDRQAFKQQLVRLSHPAVLLAGLRDYPHIPTKLVSGSARAQDVAERLDRAAIALGLADLLPSSEADVIADGAVKDLASIDFTTEVFADAAWARLVARAAVDRFRTRGDCGERSFCARLIAAQETLQYQAENQLHR